MTRSDSAVLFLRAPGAAHVDDAGVVYVLVPGGSRVVRLDGVAPFVWSLLEGGADLDTIVAELRTVPGAPSADEVTEIAAQFLSRATSEGIVDVAERRP